MSRIVAEWEVSRFMGIGEAGLAITPGGPGSLTVIEGGTGAGKTSALYALLMGLRGNCPQKYLVQDGEGRAQILVRLEGDDLDPVTIKRGVENDTTKTLTVKGMDTTGGDQTALNRILGGGYINADDILSDDPARLEQAFLKSVPMTLTEEQYLKLTGGRRLAVELTGHPLEVLPRLGKILYDERTGVNTEAKRLRAVEISARAQVPEGFDAEAAEALDATVVAGQLEEVNRSNAQRLAIEGNAGKERMAQRAAAEKVLRLEAELAETVKRLQAGIDAAREEETGLKAQAADSEQWLEKNGVKDATDLQAQLSGFTAQKNLLAKAQEAHGAAQDAARLEAQSTTLTEQVEAIRTKPQELLAAVNLGVEGVTVEDGHLAYMGRPLGSMCGGEKLKFAVQSQSVLAGDVRLLTIDGLEKLGEGAAELIAAEAAKTGLQVLATRTTKGGLSIRVIEADGTETVYADEEEAEAEALCATG